MRRIVSRLLLLLLAVLGVVAAVRMGGAHGGAVVWMDDLDPDRLQHQRFEVDELARVAVATAGSFEDAGGALATEAWIADAEGEVVWRFAPRRGSGTFATAADTLDLAPGLYDAYFAAFGTGAAAPRADGALGRLRHAMTRGQAWRGDAGRWRLRVDPASDAHRDRLNDLQGRDSRRAERAAVWASGPLGDDERRDELFSVATPTRITLRAVLEATPGRARDRAAVVRLGGAAADTVWAFSHSDSRPAGGAARNRRADATLDLAPGLYRIVAETDGRHAYDDWRATPPHAPWMWGLSVLSAEGGVLDPLQPSNDFALPVIAAFECVGTDEYLEDTFTLDRTTEAVITSAGEVFEDSIYDWGWLDRHTASGDLDRVWELDREGSVSAGGGDKNRKAIGVLTLRAGTYTLGYQTDGSHDCHGYNTDVPADRDFWGVSLYALSPGFDASTVRRARPAPTPTPPSDDDTSTREDDEPTPPIAALERVALGADEAVGFQAPPSGRVLVSAHTRTAPDAPQAVGWIEDADGTTVWSTRDDEHAGKRYVMDFVDLDADARYTLRYAVDPDEPETSFEIRSIRVVPIGGRRARTDDAGGE